MNPEAPKTNRLAAVAAIGMVGITLYWTFTYSGPYRYLAELQVKSLGYYVPKLTAMLIIVGFLAIAGVIKVVLRGAERPVPGPENVPPTGIPAVRNAAVPQPWVQYVRYAAPLIVAGIGGWMYFNGTQAGSLQQLTAVDFESGKLPSRIVYADVRGHLSGMYLSKENYLYIPMYTNANGKTPVRLVVGVNEKEANKRLRAEADGSVTVRGIADKGLEGDVKYAFEKNGMAVADTVWVVHTGRAPGDDRTAGTIIMAIGVALAGLFFAIDSYKKRKNAAVTPLQLPA
ncbi:MAG TPA: hypothetical protein VJN92_12055 [Candidatus Acidoferrum sp.]|nr:hypothetical protein [Candidatus Acidoferrum sp.]